MRFGLGFFADPQAIINLRPISRDCLLAVETRQIYCAQTEF